MYIILRTFLISLFLLFTCHSFVYAKLYVNEFSSFTSDDDWIELHNTEPNSILLENYCIQDDSSTNKLLLEGTIATGEFILFNWTNKLNKSDDVIKLFFNCDESQPPIDQVTYGKSEKDVVAPSEGQTAGRKTDGGEEWTIFAEASAGKPNTTPLAPTETPIPTNTLAPTRTPTPTKTPTPTPTPKTPIPTKVPAHTKTPTPIKLVSTFRPTITILPSPKINTISITKSKTIKTTVKPTRKSLPTAILGISSKSAKLNLSPQKNKSKSLTKSGTDTKSPIIIFSISIAILLISCAILFFIKRKKLNQES